MIIAKLMGGLGNQMFQYAAGRCLAEKRKDRLLLETNSISSLSSHPREYGLGIFNIHAEFTNIHEIIKASDLLFHIREFKPGFHKGVFECPYQFDIALDGFWQHESYFKEIENIIRKEFTFKISEYKTADLLLDKHSASTAGICIHVRRGDYLLPEGSHLVTLGTDYYKRAVKYIASVVRNPHFYIFSDDIDWCVENLSLDYPHTYIRHNRPELKSTAEDFRRMTMCQHFIIANSSFSWWAAWLGSSDGKIVVAPTDWIRNDHIASKNMAPTRWIRL